MSAVEITKDNVWIHRANQVNLKQKRNEVRENECKRLTVGFVC